MSTLASNLRVSHAWRNRLRHTEPVLHRGVAWRDADHVFFALLLRDSAVIEGVYLPRTNDSLYHARRILDAAVGNRGFYQFDERLHAPDGAWIPWPWAYDYLLAKLTQVAVWVAPTLDPAAFIAYAPVAWIFVNAALFMAAAGAIGLPAECRLLAMVCFALSPLTQLLHAVGMIDHHYVEHTFVLATIWLGLRWFEHLDKHTPRRRLGRDAGPRLRVSQRAVHTAARAARCGVRALAAQRGAAACAPLRGFAIALLVTTQLILLPSEPYRRLMFEFGLLSWFHFYVAVCTSVAVGLHGVASVHAPQSRAARPLCGLLALPLGAQVIAGAGFLSGEFSVLDQIVEVRSPYALARTLGPAMPISYYTWLLLAAPLLLAFYAYRVFRERDRRGFTTQSRPFSAWRCCSISSACTTSGSSPW